MLDKSCQTGQHSYADRGLDLYETPACATEALLRAESLPPHIWEPAAGRGAISRVLKKAGHIVTSSDIEFYDGRDKTIICPIDFFSITRKPLIQAIVTNPPYKDADKFVRHALKLCPRVIMLLRLAFLESVRRTDILEHSGLARVHVFRNRLPMMHRDGWSGKRASSAVPFAWFVWDRDHTGPTELHRISWSDDNV